MTDASLRSQLSQLAANLASLWNGGRPIVDALVDAGGDPWASPSAALAKLDGAQLEAQFGGRTQEIDEAVDGLQRYLGAQTWFDRAQAKNPALRALDQGPVAYFCTEFGLAKWLPIYSGGLGILAGDVLKEASDMGLPFVGITLLYRHGYFHQKLNEERRQTERYDTLAPEALGLEPATTPDGGALFVEIPMADRTIVAAVWKLQVGRVTLLLLDTNTPRNESQDDREITGTLYGGDQETRIRQEIVLGIGGVRALKALGLSSSVYSMNEGHAAFLGLELVADRLGSSDLRSALQRVRPQVVYTNHTVVPAGNDIFSHDLVRRYLGPYVQSRGIGIDDFLALATAGYDPAFQMAVLAFQMSGKANAVSELHAKVIPREWPGFHVEAVTNGVHVPTWTGPRIQSLLDEYVPDWRGDEPDWGLVADIPSDRLQAARDEQRALMASYLADLQPGANLDPKALTLVWARRFAEYKRAFLIGENLATLARILTQADRPVQLVFSGKSHPRDEGGKTMMQNLLNRLSGDAAVANRVTFIEDYSEEVGRYLTMGADVWLNTPRKPLEASGTSGMKSSDNGGLQLTVTDGWAAEVDWYGVGWGIAGADDATDAAQLYDFLENSLVPTFFARDENGVAVAWAEMMKRTMTVTLSRYSARRMMLDYVHKLYLPLLEEQTAVGAAAG